MSAGALNGSGSLLGTRRGSQRNPSMIYGAAGALESEYCQKFDVESGKCELNGDEKPNFE